MSRCVGLSLSVPPDPRQYVTREGVIAMAVVADRVEITVLVENWIDMLLPDAPEVSRFGLIEHFDPKRTPPQAENGISLLVRVQRDEHVLTLLFDVGLTGSVLLHNANALNISLHEIDDVVISHGHPDHYGGIYALLDSLDRMMLVATHPDAFLPRYAVMGDGRAAPFYNMQFNSSELERRGGRVVASHDPLEYGTGVFTTGEIPRTTEFEGPQQTVDPRAPGLYQVQKDGKWVADQVWDEQGLVIHVRNEGLVILTGCAHAGVVNTILRAVEIADENKIRAVIGGFHLGFPTTPDENVDKTVEALREMGVGSIVPMHCSGMKAHAQFAQRLDRSYLQPAVGSVFRFGT